MTFRSRSNERGTETALSNVSEDSVRKTSHTIYALLTVFPAARLDAFSDNLEVSQKFEICKEFAKTVEVGLQASSHGLRRRGSIALI